MTRLQTYHCQICGVELNQPRDEGTRDCGGDCLRCMAYVAEDPDCNRAMDSIPTYPQSIILVSDSSTENGYQLHGLFSCFAEALNHVRKDEGTEIPDWNDQETPTTRTYINGDTRWVASRQSLR